MTIKKKKENHQTQPNETSRNSWLVNSDTGSVYTVESGNMPKPPEIDEPPS